MIVHRQKIIPICFMAIMLSGCASTLTAIFDRSVSTEYLRPNPKEGETLPHHIVLTMTGERRIIVSGPHAGKPSEQLVCAESIPDVARAVGAASGGSASLPVTVAGAQATQQLSYSDSFQSSLLSTFNRTETADVVRQLGWQNCIAFLNGAVSETEYRENLKGIIERAFNTLDKSAARALPAPGTTVINGATGLPIFRLNASPD